MRNSNRGFTLVELLVVIGIIATLVAMLLPVLSRVQGAGRTAVSLSNLRQIGVALGAYRAENRGVFPVAGYASLPDRARFRWMDALYVYGKSTEVYRSPALSEEDRVRLRRPFFHTTAQTSNPGILAGTIYAGGYGYNYQYLGNGREFVGTPAFFARQSGIRASDRTIAVADTDGSNNGTAVKVGEGPYVVDPPRMSVELGSRGSRKASGVAGPGNYGYSGGNDGDASHRSTPAARNGKGKSARVAVLFVDGHATTLTLREMDDSNNDGVVDNGLWNGLGDPTRR